MREIITVLTDYHANGSYEILRNHVQLLDSPDYALMIRTVDFENDDFENNVKYISEDAYHFLKKTQIFGKEIIINKIGNAGRAYIVPPLKKNISLGMNQFMVRPNKEVLAGYLYAYLICKYGSQLLQQKVTGASPPSIDKESARSVKVPVLDKDFQKKIDTIIDSLFIAREKSKNLYYEAERILLSELGILNWKPKHQFSFNKNFSDTQSAYRFDAEYFQPMYEEIVRAVESSKTYIKLGDIVSIKKSNEPGSDEYQDHGVPFLRVSNLSKFGINTDNQQFISETLYNSLWSHQPRKGEILLSKDATPGIAYFLRDIPHKMIPSGGVLRLKVKDTDAVYPEYLTLVLNSIIVQKQIERDVGGSVINHWLVDQVRNAIIPILSISTQKRIVELIEQSFSCLSQSKKLLDLAKHAVEFAIEEDEERAMAFLGNHS